MEIFLCLRFEHCCVLTSNIVDAILCLFQFRVLRDSVQGLRSIVGVGHIYTLKIQLLKHIYLKYREFKIYFLIYLGNSLLHHYFLGGL